MEAHRRAILGAALLGGSLGAIAIVAFSGGNVARMTLSDGLIARYVAAHLDTPPENVDPVVVERGTSLRYGRIGLPWLIWLASAGRPAAMPYAQPVIMVLCAAAVAAAARALFPRAPPAAALVPLASVGFLLSVVGGFADAAGAALGVWAVVAARDGRWRWCALVLAGALLARENAGGILLGIIVAYRLWRIPRALATVLASVVPVGLWYLFVNARYGHIPLLDPYITRTTSTAELPGLGIWHSLAKTSGDSFAMAVVTLCIALAAFALWRRSALGTIAAVCAVQILGSGPFAFKFIGEAARTSTFVQLFLLLALAARRYADHEGADAPTFARASAIPNSARP